MVTQLWDWLLHIPQVIAEFGDWLMNPIYEPYISLSPLELLGTTGVALIVIIIGIHVVRLFVG